MQEENKIGINNTSANQSSQQGNVMNSQIDNLSIGYQKETNNKKIFFGIIIFILVLLMSGAAYFFIFKKGSIQIPGSDTSISFPNLNNTNGTDFYTNTTNQNNQEGNQNGEIIEQDNSELAHVWTRPILTYVYKKEKKIEVISSQAQNSEDLNISTSTNIAQASTTDNNEANLIQKTIEKEVNMIYFLDKATGNIYRAEKPLYNPERVSKTNITNIKQAAFDFGGDYLAVIKDGVLTVDRVSKNIDGEYSISNTVDEKVVSIYNNNFDNNFLYTKNENGGLGMYKYDTLKNKTSKLGYVPLTNIKIEWKNKDSVFMITAASDNYKQNILTFNINTGKLNNYIISNGSNVFLGSDILYTVDGVLKYKNLKGQESDMEINTFADKCIFIGDLKAVCSVPNIIANTNIDNWYMGITNFTDSLYYFDLSTGDRKNFFDHSLVSGESIDSYNMSYKNNQLIMQNKNDDSLWVLDTEFLLK